MNGVDWMIADGGRIFNGNKDQNTIVKHELQQPVTCRCIQICPIAWNSRIYLLVN